MNFFFFFNHVSFSDDIHPPIKISTSISSLPDKLYFLISQITPISSNLLIAKWNGLLFFMPFDFQQGLLILTTSAQKLILNPYTWHSRHILHFSQPSKHQTLPQCVLTREYCFEFLSCNSLSFSVPALRLFLQSEIVPSFLTSS